MKIAIFLSVVLVTILISCSKYTSWTYPFMDWSKPDSIFNSYDTLKLTRTVNNRILIRFWFDPSSTVKQYIEIKDTINGYKAIKVKYGNIYNKKHKTKRILSTSIVTPKSNWNDLISRIDSLNFMNYKSRYHSWQTDGGPMHSLMIWFRIEYFNKDIHNDFVFWKFAGSSMPDDMKEYEKIVTLIDNEFYNNRK